MIFINLLIQGEFIRKFHILESKLYITRNLVDLCMYALLVKLNRSHSLSIQDYVKNSDFIKGKSYISV